MQLLKWEDNNHAIPWYKNIQNLIQWNFICIVPNNNKVITSCSLNKLKKSSVIKSLDLTDFFKPQVLKSELVTWSVQRPPDSDTLHA